MIEAYMTYMSVGITEGDFLGRLFTLLAGGFAASVAMQALKLLKSVAGMSDGRKRVVVAALAALATFVNSFFGTSLPTDPTTWTVGGLTIVIETILAFGFYNILVKKMFPAPDKAEVEPTVT